MSIATENPVMTPDELLRMPNESHYELIDGVLRERIRMIALSSWIAGNILMRLGSVVAEQKHGWLFPVDAGVQCFGEEANTMRRPDVCFVRADRLPVEQIGEGYLRVVPDLVVEVLSPHDLAEDVEEKVRLFREAGVPLIWVVSPAARTVRIIRLDGSSTHLAECDQLSGEEVIPGFACPVSSIFLPKPPARVEPTA